MDPSLPARRLRAQPSSRYVRPLKSRPEGTYKSPFAARPMRISRAGVQARAFRHESLHKDGRGGLSMAGRGLALACAAAVTTAAVAAASVIRRNLRSIKT